jgi:hypothetical protein
MTTIRFFIAGVQFRPKADIDRAFADGIAEGSKLQLVPEPTNKYDPHAIAVHHFGVLIGYVPKAMQPTVGAATTAIVEACDQNDPPWERFKVAVEVGDASEDSPSHGHGAAGAHHATSLPRSEEPVSFTELEIVAPTYAVDSIGATEEARRRRDDLLNEGRAATSIVTADGARSAADLMQRMTKFTRTIEETREVVKRPLLEAGRKIDSAAKSLVLDLEAESKRLGNLIGAYQTQQRQLEEENRRRAWEEQQRVLRENQERDRKIREEAESKRVELNDARNAKVREINPSAPWAETLAEATEDQFAQLLKGIKESVENMRRAEAAASKAKSEKAKAEAARRAQELRDAEAKRQREADELAEQQRKDRETREAQEEQDRWNKAALESSRAVELASKPANKIEGIAVGSEIKFEVTDIVALYESAPYLVKLEPNNASIKSALKQLGKDQTLPGVRHWREAKTVVRK